MLPPLSLHPQTWRIGIPLLPLPYVRPSSPSSPPLRPPVFGWLLCLGTPLFHRPSESMIFYIFLWYHLPLRLLLVVHPLHSPICCGCLFLVGCCIISSISGQRLGHGVLYCILFFVAQFSGHNNGTTFSHAIPPPHTFSLASPLLLLPTIGWLLHCIIKRRQTKAKAPSFSLFFDGACVDAPNKGTNSGAT